MDIPLILYRISGWTLDLVYIILCIRAFQKLWFWKAHYRYFFFYLIIITILEIISSVTALFGNNLFLNYIYIVVEFILLGLFLEGIIKNRPITIFIYVMSILFFGFNIYNAFWGEGYKNPGSIGIFMLNLYLIAISLWAYTVIFKEVDGKNIFKRHITWFVLGILLVYSSNVLFDYLYGIAIKSNFYDNALYAFLIIQNLLKSAYLLLYLKGISLIEKK